MDGWPISLNLSDGKLSFVADDQTIGDGGAGMWIIYVALGSYVAWKAFQEWEQRKQLEADQRALDAARLEEEARIMEVGAQVQARLRELGAPDEVTILATTGGHPLVNDRIAYMWSDAEGLHLAGGTQGGPVIIGYGDILGVRQHANQVVMRFKFNGISLAMGFPSEDTTTLQQVSALLAPAESF